MFSAPFLRHVGNPGAMLGIAFLLSLLSRPPAALAQWPVDPPKPGDDQTSEKFEDVVKIDVMPSVDRITPGASFDLAVRFDIRRDWQIFWRNPSEANDAIGSNHATRIEIKAPEGFRVGDVRYPAPTGWNRPNGRRDFVYEDATALFVEIKCPDELPEQDQLRFEINAEWSTRKQHAESMYHYTRAVSRDIPVAEAGRTPRPIHEDELKPFRARLPKPWEEAQDISAAWRGSVLDTFVEFTFTDVDHVDFFPLVQKLNPNEFESKEVGPGPTNETVVMKVHYSAVNASALQPVVCYGVVLQQRGDDVECFQVKLPRPLKPRFGGSSEHVDAP